MVIVLISRFSTGTFSSEEFTKDKYLFTIKATEPFSLLLRGLLKHEGSGKLWWALTAGKPSWINLDQDGEIITGIPTIDDVGSHHFAIVVKENDFADDDGAISLVTLMVLPNSLL